MELTKFSVHILILFLPGIIGASIFQLFSNKGRMNNRDFIIKTIIISFISYIFVYIMSRCSSCIKCSFFDSLTKDDIVINWDELLLPLIVGVFVSFIYIKLSNSNIFHSFANRYNISTCTGEIDVWGELFNNSNKGLSSFVYIIFLKDNLIYGGYVKHYSLTRNRREIVMNQVVVYDNLKRNKKIRDLDRVYLQLTDNENIIIELIDKQKGINNGR